MLQKGLIIRFQMTIEDWFAWVGSPGLVRLDWFAWIGSPGIGSPGIGSLQSISVGMKNVN